MLFLASASQRRTELLDLMQITHKVIPQDFDEDSIQSQDPIECSQQIVKGKNISARELLKNNDEDTPIMTAVIIGVSSSLFFRSSRALIFLPLTICCEHSIGSCDCIESSSKSCGITLCVICIKSRSSVRLCEAEARKSTIL